MRIRWLPSATFILVVVLIMNLGCSQRSTMCPGIGCGTVASPSPSPPATLPPTRVYVGNVSGGIDAFNLPISATSTPAAAISTLGSSPGGGVMNFDATGRLYVAQGSVGVYSQPIRTGSNPAFRFKTPNGCSSPPMIPPCSAYEVSLDSAGDAFVLEDGSCHPFPCLAVGEFKAPLTNASAESVHFPVLGYDDNIALDGAGNLWLSSSNGLGPSGICEFGPSFNATPAFCFSIGGPIYLRGMAFDSTGNLYAASDTGVWVMNPPFSGATTPAFRIDSGDNNRSVAFDSNGNLYTISNYGKNLNVYSPPFSASSTPSVTFSLSALGINGGPIAIGP